MIGMNWVVTIKIADQIKQYKNEMNWVVTIKMADQVKTV